GDSAQCCALRPRALRRRRDTSHPRPHTRGEAWCRQGAARSSSDRDDLPDRRDRVAPCEQRAANRPPEVGDRITLRRGRLLLAVAALAVAAVAAVLASDLRAWNEAVAAGDRTFAVHPAQARWNPATVLPAGLSRDLLGISDDLDYRHAVQAFVAVQRAGCGV